MHLQFTKKTANYNPNAAECLEAVSKFVAADVMRRRFGVFGEIRLLTSAATLKIEF
jgi:hypothetical protein